MNSLDMLSAMLSLQQRLNDETNGLSWKEGYTKEGKEISFKRCIYMECAELMNSFAWKHWKGINEKTDWQNVYIELVDIWHFILSLLLKEEKKDKIAESISSAFLFKDFCLSEERTSDTKKLLNDIESLIHKSSSPSFKAIELLPLYFSLCIKCGLNLKSLYKGYLAKNVLNKFRQDKGYKEGLYVKIWKGKEDNEVLNEFLAEDKSFDELYKELERIYEAL